MLSNMAQLTFFITQTLQEYENIVNRIRQAFNIGILLLEPLFNNEWADRVL